MNSAEFDNPVWSALCGPHRTFAQRQEDLAWYPSSIAPFAAIPSPRVLPDLESAHDAGLGDRVYFVGACPQRLPQPWRLLSRSQILQLFPSDESSELRDTAGTILGRTDWEAMQELTQIAFPDFFGARTPELGLYLGVYQGARLIAMGGQRMALDGLQEISGVRTHPQFARGLYRDMGFCERASLPLHLVGRAASKYA